MQILSLSMPKKLSLAGLIAGLLISFNASAYTYINTQSFALAEVEGGIGKLDSAQTYPWSVGAGYQWVQSEQVTLGFEGEFLDNGTVNQNGVSTSSNAWVPMFSSYYYWTPHINSAFKMGYGYVTNELNSIRQSQWEPVVSTNLGFLIPFSKAVYLNLSGGITWIDQPQSNFSQNLQYKLGIQLLF